MKAMSGMGVVWLSVVLCSSAWAVTANDGGRITQGRLDALGPKGQTLGSCPLRHTDVKVEIAGFITRVTVRQQFQNPFQDKIEAVYVFPLSQNAAVDKMTMRVGERLIEGQIKERGEARAIYESAKAAGKVASLLDQERPNIFTQSVANIEPGEQVDITISYSETLLWKDGEYQFAFPMVVGPRYMPGQASGQPTTGWSPPTDQVPDAGKISPPVTPEGTRAGHDISIAVSLNAGLPLRRIDSQQHAVTVKYGDAEKTRAEIQLEQKETIPNKDFILVYQTSSEEIEDAVLTHTDQRGKFFTLVLQPPKRVRSAMVVPKELIFVIDSSGSMSGFPIETAKKAMALCIEGLHPDDTLNLITFSGHTSFCFDKPVANTEENRRQAQAFLQSLRGSGGTEMMRAIHTALADQHDPKRVRVVCFMTDGFVGNDMAIIDAVAKNAGTARVFSFGIGRSVNRYLLDGMARAGRGEVHCILDDQQALGAAERFYERVRMPVLTDVEVDFGGLAVSELLPGRIPDLFSSTPVVITGQYKQGGAGTITLRGKTGEGKFERKIDVTFPDEEPKNEVLASLWARAKVEDLMNQDLSGAQSGQPNPAVKEEVLGLGLRYRLLTQYTSFVAVEQVRITEGGQARTVAVPVEMPEGVSYEGVFGDRLARGVAFGLTRQSAMRGGAFMGRYAAGPMPAKPQAAAGATPLRLAEAAKSASPADEADTLAVEEAKRLPENKLAPELRGLAEKVAKAGHGESLLIGRIQIKAGRVEIRVQLSALSEAVLAKLKALGFKELGQAKSVRLVIGSIEIKQLEALSKLDEVRRVDPVQ